MSASEKQKNANRANAQKCTGPKTPYGKYRSSLNAVKHGLFARAAVVESPHYTEDILEYDKLLGALYDELRPEGLMQECLVRKIANCIWRHRRIVAAETARISTQMAQIDIERQSKLSNRRLRNEIFGIENSDKDVMTDEDLIGILSIPDENFSMRLLRYELRLDRQLSRSMKLLRFLKLYQKRYAPPDDPMQPVGRVPKRKRETRQNNTGQEDPLPGEGGEKYS